jgi:tetratricopeptide (TPR) repeat protein
MKSSKAPVIIIAIVLLALIAIPLVIFFTPTGNGGRNAVPVMPNSSGTIHIPVENELKSLLNIAEDLVENRMREAVRTGQFGLDRYQRYRNDLDRASDLLQRGRIGPARERLQRLLSDGEKEIAAIEMREKALSTLQSIAMRLQQNQHLKVHFQNSFKEIQDLLSEGQTALQRFDYTGAHENFDAAYKLLDVLEEAALIQAEVWIEAAQNAIDNGELRPAREAFEKVLSYLPDHREATMGLAEVVALEGVEEEIQTISQLEQEGDLDAALAKIAEVIASMPENPLLKMRKKALQDAIRERDYTKAMEAAQVAAQAGDLDGQIVALERALNLKADEFTLQQLREAVAHRDRARLEDLLANAFSALRSADYVNARDLYRQALTLNPQSNEASEGLERSARLLIAEIEFRENLASARRLADQGRFPMSASFFNRAMKTRPANLPETEDERSLRSTLERQSQQVALTLRSDNQTFVSIVGVFPPERFRSKDLMLYPDVYRIRGTRKGQPDVEIEIRVNVENGPISLTVIADGR